MLGRAGLRPQRVGGAGDKGVDIKLGDGTIVQCKAHRGPVPPAAARELYGTLEHFKAPQAILVSRSGVTKGVREFVEGKPIKIWGVHDLISLQKRLDEQ